MTTPRKVLPSADVGSRTSQLGTGSRVVHLDFTLFGAEAIAVRVTVKSA
ncbi:hypothetical protein QFZ58_006689 [Streptomyces sp. B1I3]|nr:hypothetical protein [Streptomyces sp. B1I3]